MPKSNTEFWTKKFAENVERDRRVARDLAEKGWRVLVVWECELVDRTVETVDKVAAWLRRDNDIGARSRYYRMMPDRGTLLAVAEKKVRHRISTYDQDSS